MPTYLCHGFRWRRLNIRVAVMMGNLEDAAPDWIVGRTTSALILGLVHTLWDFLPEPEWYEPPAPSPPPGWPLSDRSGGRDGDYDDNASDVSEEEQFPMVEKSEVKLLEEYNIEERTDPSRPYAYVADHVVEIDLGASVTEEMAKYERIWEERGEPWIGKLRDQLEMHAEIGWYVVVCGDEERSVPDLQENASDDETPTESLRTTPAQSQASRPEEQTESRRAPMLGEQLDAPQTPPSPRSRKLSKQQASRHKPSRTKGLLRLFGKSEAR